MLMATHRSKILVPNPCYHPDDFPSLACGVRHQVGERADIERRLALHPDILTVPDAAGISGLPKERRSCQQQHAARADVERRLDLLTPRQYQVFALVISGETSKEIAGTLSISERTVKAHRLQMMEKMEAPSLVILGRLAERVGIVWPSV